MPSPTLTIIIPVYDEAATLRELIERTLMLALAMQVIAVDDGSTDGSRGILEDYARRGAIELAVHRQNLGKGSAIRTALAQATGEFTVVLDADLELYPEDIPALLEPVERGVARVVYGVRQRCGGATWGAERAVLRGGVGLLNWLVRALYGARIADEAAGLKVFPTELLRQMNLQCDGFEFCPEVTAKALRMHYTIHEVPIRYLPRTRQQGKKLRIVDGWRAIVTLWHNRRWQPANAAASAASATRDAHTTSAVEEFVSH